MPGATDGERFASGAVLGNAGRRRRESGRDERAAKTGRARGGPADEPRRRAIAVAVVAAATVVAAAKLATLGNGNAGEWR